MTTAFESIKDAVLLLGIEADETYRILLANKAFHDMSGFPQGCIGQLAAEVFDPNGYDFLRERLKKVIKTKQQVDYTRWAKVPLGRRAYEVQLIPIFNTVDEVVQIVIVAGDITELAKLKEEVQTLRAANYRRHATPRHKVLHI